MITPFDALMFVGIFVAMGLSNEPKKSAIAVVLYLNLICTALDYLFDGWPARLMMSMSEALGGILLLAYAHSLEYKDRIYFRMMAALLFLSAATLLLRKFRIIYPHSDYVMVSHVIALTHLTFMMIFSDGFGLAIRNLRNTVAVYRGRIVDPRC